MLVDERWLPLSLSLFFGVYSVSRQNTLCISRGNRYILNTELPLMNSNRCGIFAASSRKRGAAADIPNGATTSGELAPQRLYILY